MKFVITKKLKFTKTPLQKKKIRHLYMQVFLKAYMNVKTVLTKMVFRNFLNFKKCNLANCVQIQTNQPKCAFQYNTSPCKKRPVYNLANSVVLLTIELLVKFCLKSLVCSS